MLPIESISVLMPTWQGMAFLERVFGALAAQRCEVPWDMWVVDSGSTDGTWEQLQTWRERLGVPLHLEQIHPLEFNHGDTRNLLVARSGGDLCVFLTQDAIPCGSDWLATLAGPFTGPGQEGAGTPVGAAYCRNVPRADALPLTRLLCASDPGYALESTVTRLPDPQTYADLDPDGRRLLYNFNDVASALPRELWERHPFPRTAFGEDILQARALLEAGYAIAYDADAAVEHSHDYDAQETFTRACIDGRFNAQWLDRICMASERDVDVLCERLRLPDEEAVDEAVEALPFDGPTRAELHAGMRTLRRTTFEGLLQGGRAPERFAPTKMRSNGHLRVLFVLHGFPPDTWAGTEIYTLNLARELQSRGHQVTIFARSPARSPEEEELTVLEEPFQGLRVLRLVHRLEHRSLAESFSKPAVERVFQRVLDAEDPDLVHFQHLIHTSVGLVKVARDAGKATVVTCHDYWALCARVQLIRPDGERCEGNMGAGCFPCVKERRLGDIPLARRLGALGAGPLDGLLREFADATWTPGTLRRQAQEYLDLREREMLVPAAYAACDLMISPSRYLRQVYLQSGHFDPERLIFSDNGMRTDHVQALEKAPDSQGRVRFGFIGSLVWYKGGEVLMRAMNRLQGEHCVLSVHGDFRPEEDPHHAHLASLVKGDNVEFRGRFDNEHLSDVYAEIDVLIVPSLWVENSPVTIHEAFLTRTPVLASDIGGMAEFVVDGENGLQFQVGDDEDLARKMLRFISDPELLQALSQSFPKVKTIAENAEEMEFRYRALCCRERRVEGQSREFRGADCFRREGPVEVQGPDLLLLRPGGARVEFDLSGLDAGEVLLHLTLLALGAEPGIEQGGRLFLNDEEVGAVPLFRADGQDERRQFSFNADLGPGTQRLSIETSLTEGGPEAYLRIAALVVERTSATPAAHKPS